MEISSLVQVDEEILRGVSLRKTLRGFGRVWQFSPSDLPLKEREALWKLRWIGLGSKNYIMHFFMFFLSLCWVLMFLLFMHFPTILYLIRGYLFDTAYFVYQYFFKPRGFIGATLRDSLIHSDMLIVEAFLIFGSNSSWQASFWDALCVLCKGSLKQPKHQRIQEEVRFGEVPCFLHFPHLEEGRRGQRWWSKIQNPHEGSMVSG